MARSGKHGTDFDMSTVLKVKEEMSSGLIREELEVIPCRGAKDRKRHGNQEWKVWYKESEG